MNTLLDEVDWVASESLLLGHDSPFEAALTAGHPRIVVITGENASGKSLFVRVLSAKATAGANTKKGATTQKTKRTTVSVSIRERTGSGSGDMSRMAQAFMFGDESDSSTGAISARVVNNLLSKNLDRPEGSLAVLDEPEIGLSDGYARALGELIGSHVDTLPDACTGLVLVTHSRSLVSGLLTHVPDPSWVHVRPRPGAATTTGDPVEVPASLNDWLTATEHRSIEDLLALPQAGHERFQAVHQLMKN